MRVGEYWLMKDNSVAKITEYHAPYCIADQVTSSGDVFLKSGTLIIHTEFVKKISKNEAKKIVLKYIGFD